jgi:hypothetical protein
VYLNPWEAFDAVDINCRGVLHMEDVIKLICTFDKDYTNSKVQALMQMLDLSENGHGGGGGKGEGSGEGSGSGGGGRGGGRGHGNDGGSSKGSCGGSFGG